MFIETPQESVNLKNVSNINIIHKSKRIVFNMNYGISIKDRMGEKIISDYVYWDSNNEKQFQKNLDLLYTKIKEHGNFIPKPERETSGYINIDEISSIKFNTHKNRVIFNLSHTVSISNHRNERALSSEFVYVDFDNIGDAFEYTKIVKQCL